MNNKYNLYDNEILVGTFTASEISQKIGIDKRQICIYERKQSRFKKRYRIEESGQRTIKEIKQDWNETIAKIRKLSDRNPVN